MRDHEHTHTHRTYTNTFVYVLMCVSMVVCVFAGVCNYKIKFNEQSLSADRRGRPEKQKPRRMVWKKSSLHFNTWCFCTTPPSHRLTHYCGMEAPWPFSCPAIHVVSRWCRGVAATPITLALPEVLVVLDQNSCCPDICHGTRLHFFFFLFSIV